VAERTLVIAEAGVNHNGSLDLARQMVDVAAEAGADIIKFQTFEAVQLVTASAAKAAYQTANTGEGDSQMAMLRKLELSREAHHELVSHARQRGIRFMSTAFDASSLAFLATLDMPAIKIPSGDITCAPLLLQAARLRKPLIVSSGMATLADIEHALGVIAFGLTTDREPTSRTEFATAYRSVEGQRALETSVTLLHCVTQYPAPAHATNLRAMDSMVAAFGLPVGYSDHSAGIDIAIAAVARGARVIEKHFTLDRQLPGPDHAASLEPAELKQMVQAIRNVELALGSPLKRPVSEELPNIPVARRSLVATRNIAAGEVFTADALSWKRPGSGVSPMEYWDMLGKKAQRSYNADDLIEP
jgi:N-acetylneuraminate synthase